MVGNYPAGVTDSDPHFTDESEYEEEDDPEYWTCVSPGRCLVVSPVHSQDECYTVDNAEDYAGEYERTETKPLTYLACPYSHPDRDVRVARFDAVNRVASELMRQGLKIFSPISHCHPIAEAGGLPLGWDFWHEYDHAFLSASNKLIVLMVDGWKESTGVTGEIAIARELGIEIQYMQVEGKGE